MSKKEEAPKQVEVSSAKGRPMLSWVGKKTLRYVPALPAQHVETYDPSGDLAKIKPRTTWLDWPTDYPKSGLLFHGDNKEVLAHLLANGFRGRVNLIYIDPPFDSGADYIRKVELRGVKGKTRIEGENYSVGEQIQYADIWANDAYLQFMYERILLMRELLAEKGSFFLHCDWRRSSHLRLVLDEVFGAACFRAQITWRTMTSSGYKGKSSLGRSHADILYYSKDPQEFSYNRIHTEMSEEMRKRYKHCDPDGRYFKDSYLGDATPETIEELKKENKLYTTSKGGYRIKHYLGEAEGLLVDDVWTDINPENSQSENLTGYPTQKPEELVNRIITLATNPGDIVMDCFIGSGTTAASAQRLGRRWIGCDINKGAIQTTSKRLQNIIDDLIMVDKREQRMLEEIHNQPEPTQTSLCIFRVNDYDLQVQHNEAIKLACEYIGVETSLSDTYFDGTLGKQIVKIIPFSHPLSPIDLEDLKRELEARKDEDRDIVLVCLGMELAAQSWVDEWNRLRKKGGNVPNRLRVIELRTDPKYSGFIKHDPATARVKIRKSKGRIGVKIEDFVSPTIIKRLEMEQDLFQKKIKDWRSMVDCVMIDPDYDGQLFNVALSDLPAIDKLISNVSYSSLEVRHETIRKSQNTRETAFESHQTSQKRFRSRRDCRTAGCRSPFGTSLAGRLS